jgi:hypothetical protein
MENFPLQSKNNLYNLVIRFSKNGLLLSISDNSKNIISKKQISAEIFSMSEHQITNLIKNDYDTQAEFKTLELICESDIYTFVPMPYFNNEDANDLLNFDSRLKKSDAVLINKLPNWETVNVFSIPKVLNDSLKKTFPDFHIIHHLSIILSNIKSKSSDTEVFIWTREKVMDVIVLKAGNIQLINSFEYQTTEDFTYYALNIFEQLMLDTETCKIRLYNSENKPELKNSLQKYIKDVLSFQ